MRQLIIFFKYFGRLNYYQGVDKLSVLDWLWRYRMSVDTAWGLAKLITKTNSDE